MKKIIILTFLIILLLYILCGCVYPKEYEIVDKHYLFQYDGVEKYTFYFIIKNEDEEIEITVSENDYIKYNKGDKYRYNA